MRGVGARLKRAEIELRLDLDEGAQPFAAGVARKQRPPGEEGGFSFCRCLQCVGKGDHWAVDVGQLGLALGNAHQRRAEAVHHAAQGRIGSERAQERLCLDQLRHGVAHFAFLQEQKPVALEKRAAVRAAHRGEQRLIFGEFGGERIGCAVGTLGGGTVDHHQDEVVPLGKQLVETHFLLAPGQIGRN